MITADKLQNINFDEPTAADVALLTQVLNEEDRNLLICGGTYIRHISSNDRLVRNNYRIGIYRETLCLMYDYERKRPFKKTAKGVSVCLEFHNPDRLLACSNGGCIMYPHETCHRDLFERIIEPIVNAFGLPYNKDGEYLRPGAQSMWNN